MVVYHQSVWTFWPWHLHPQSWFYEMFSAFNYFIRVLSDNWWLNWGLHYLQVLLFADSSFKFSFAINCKNFLHLKLGGYSKKPEQTRSFLFTFRLRGWQMMDHLLGSMLCSDALCTFLLPRWEARFSLRSISLCFQLMTSFDLYSDFCMTAERNC